MRGFPHFSFQIPIGLAKICFFPMVVTFTDKNISVLGGTVLKDVRGNCFRVDATSFIELARRWRNVEIYSASGHFNIYARVKLC